MPEPKPKDEQPKVEPRPEPTPEPQPVLVKVDPKTGAPVLQTPPDPNGPRLDAIEKATSELRDAVTGLKTTLADAAKAPAKVRDRVLNAVRSVRFPFETEESSGEGK